MLVELDDEHTKCSICVTEFTSDRDDKDPEIRNICRCSAHHNDVIIGFAMTAFYVSSYV